MSSIFRGSGGVQRKREAWAFIFRLALAGLAILPQLTYADGRNSVGDISIGAIQAQLREFSGPGWNASGPGGECKPSVNVNCIDATTVRNLVKELAGAVGGAEVTDPAMLKLIDKIQGARTVVASTYLEFSLYLDSGIVYDLPPQPANAPKKIPIRRVVLPKTLRMNVFSNGEKGLVTIEKPEVGWRSRSLRVLTDVAPVEVVLEALEVNLLNSSLAVKAGIGDLASIWASGTFANLALAVDGKRTLLGNLSLLIIAPWIFL